MNEPLLVRREVQIAEPPANVFAFLADPEKILIWMGPRQRPRRTPAGSISSKASATQLAWRPRAFREDVRCTAWPTVSVGTETTKCRLDRALWRSI